MRGQGQAMCEPQRDPTLVSLLVHLGDRLGPYRMLDGAGPVTAEDLAGRTGLHPRWLRETVTSCPCDAGRS